MEMQMSVDEDFESPEGGPEDTDPMPGDDVVEEPALHAEGVLGVEVTLEELASRPGRWSELAGELLAIKAERESAKAQAELAARAEAVDAASAFDDVPVDDLRAMFRAEQEQARVAAEAVYISQFASQLVAQGYTEETVQTKLEALAADLAASTWLNEDADPLDSHPGYQAHIRQKVFQAQARAYADRAWVDARTMEDDAADAAEEIEHTLGQVRVAA
jgi:hypothetical protein